MKTCHICGREGSRGFRKVGFRTYACSRPSANCQQSKAIEAKQEFKETLIFLGWVPAAGVLLLIVNGIHRFYKLILTTFGMSEEKASDMATDGTIITLSFVICFGIYKYIKYKFFSPERDSE
jgi:hypothetical protein